MAAAYPPPMSPIGKPKYTGGLPGSPVTLIAPLMAWTTPSKAGRLRYGPSSPKPDSEQEMIRGFTARSVS